MSFNETRRRLSILPGIATSILLSSPALAALESEIAPAKACQKLVDLDLSGVTDKRVHIESAKETQLQGSSRPDGSSSQDRAARPTAPVIDYLDVQDIAAPLDSHHIWWPGL